MEPLLHSLILNPDKDACIKFLKNNPNHPDINSKHTELTSLSLAVREGKLELVLWLIYYGAEINLQNLNFSTALDLAIEYEHFLIAEVLRIYGAITNKSDNTNLIHFNPIVVASTLSWAITQMNFEEERHDNLFKIALITIKNEKHLLLGLIELAANYNQFNVVKILLEYGTFRKDYSVLSAGYWAVLKKQESQFNFSDEDKLIILNQLYQRNKKEFEDCFISFGEKIQEQFSNNKIEEKTNNHLTNRQKLIYQSASEGNIYQLMFFCDQAEDYIKVLNFSFNQADFVCLNYLFKIQYNEKELIKILMEMNKDLLIFYMINQQKNPYSLACLLDNKIENQKNIMDHWISEFLISPKGLIYFIFSAGIKNHFPTEKMKKILSEFIESVDKNGIILKKAIKNHHQILPNYLINQKMILFNENAALNLSEKARIKNYFKRFGMGVYEKDYKKGMMKIPQEIWTYIIIPMLTENDQAAFTSVSHQSHEWILKSKELAPSLSYIRNSKLLLLNKELEKLKTFINLVKTELSNQSFWKKRPKKPIFVLSILFLISVAGLAIGSYFFAIMQNKADKVIDKMRNTNSPNNMSCINFMRNEESLGCFNQDQAILGDCYPLCEEIESYSSIFKGSFLGMVFSSIILAPSLFFLLYYLSRFREGPSRFNTVSLRDFSPNLQMAANDLLDFEAKHYPINPFHDLSTNTEVEIFLRKIETTYNMRFIEYQQLEIERLGERYKMDFSKEHRIIIQEEKEEKLTPDSPRLSINHLNFWSSRHHLKNNDSANIPFIPKRLGNTQE